MCVWGWKLRYIVDVKWHWWPFLFLTKSSVSTKSHQLSQRPPDSIQAPRDLLHARNIHADPDKPAPDSNRPLNQPLKQGRSERQDNTSCCTAVCAKTVEVMWSQVKNLNSVFNLRKVWRGVVPPSSSFCVIFILSYIFSAVMCYDS